MNSWKPYQAYLLDGRYPFVRTIYAIVVDPRKALPWSFANYISSPVGQLIIFKSGLLPYRGDISIKTVETHVSAVLRKLQLSNRNELTRWAMQRHIV